MFCISAGAMKVFKGMFKWNNFKKRLTWFEIHGYTMIHDYGSNTQCKQTEAALEECDREQSAIHLSTCDLSYDAIRCNIIAALDTDGGLWEIETRTALLHSIEFTRILLLVSFTTMYAYMRNWTYIMVYTMRIAIVESSKKVMRKTFSRMSWLLRIRRAGRVQQLQIKVVSMSQKCRTTETERAWRCMKLLREQSYNGTVQLAGLPTNKLL